MTQNRGKRTFFLEDEFALCEQSCMEQLRLYLNSTGQTQRAFAVRIAISPSHLNEIISGRKRPSLDVALEISRATAGSVPVESWDLSISQQIGAVDIYQSGRPNPEQTNEVNHDAA